MSEQRYQRVIRYVMEQPWMIEPDALGVIIEVLEFRANGGVWTDAEIEARIGENRKSNAGSREGRAEIIRLYGTIMPRARVMEQISGGRSIEDFASDLRAADRDPDVSSIIMDISSPGGSVEMVPETAELIRNLETPTIAVVNTRAASAAYYLASQADEVVVTPSGEVGSIGVWTAHQDISGMQRHMGVKTSLISAGKYKVEGHPFGPLDKEARAAMQSKVDYYYDQFVADVALGRGESVETVRNGYGEGRMLTAPDALAEGMVDRIATLEQVIAERSDGSQPIAIAASAKITTPFFDDPQFTVPGVDARLRYDPHTDKWSCPPTVKGDHFFGHAQPMAVCLRGRPGRCITPPDGDLNGFMRHYAPAAGGQRTGVITLTDSGVHGHSAEGIGPVEATRWYDSVGRGVADVRVGRDAYGIWFSGMIRPGTSKNDRYALASSDVSSHWEPSQRNGLPVLVGMPAVNVGGFPKGYLTAEEVASGIAAAASLTIAPIEDLTEAEALAFHEALAEDCGCESHAGLDLRTVLAIHAK